MNNFFVKIGIHNILKNIVFKLGILESNNVQYDTLIPQMIKIGKNFHAEPGATITAHDGSPFHHTNKIKIQAISIGDNVTLGANSVILPGVSIGDNVIVRAGAIVSKNIPPNVVVAGNPAKVICTIQEYIEECEKKKVLYDVPIWFRNKALNGNYLSRKEIAKFQKSMLIKVKKNIIK